jgi:para-nitrobenzyl esterase
MRRREIILGGGALTAIAAARAATGILAASPQPKSQIVVAPGASTATGTSASSATVDRLTVQNVKGLIRGEYVTTANGVQVRRFLNVPYAKPPTNQNRFKEATPPDTWPGIFYATTPAKIPVQGAAPGGVLPSNMSEDCLKVNVWAPDGDGPYPVLVWIFGGGNRGGQIDLPAYDGSSFAEQGIIFVAVQYRVGLFGFLELGDITGNPADVGAGNNGIKDQLRALWWVHYNIAAFGGSVDDVTLSGQSAGAGDCTILLTAAYQDNLFKRVILASGGGGKVMDLATANTRAHKYMDTLPGGVSALYSMSAGELQQRFADPAYGFNVGGILDGDFITTAPIDVIRAGAVKDIPILLGYNRDEERQQITPQTAATFNLATYPNYSYIPDDKRAGFKAGYEAIYGPTQPVDKQLSVGDMNLRALSADWIKIPTIAIAQAMGRWNGSAYLYALAYASPSGDYQGYCIHGMDLPLDFAHFGTEMATNLGYSGGPLEVQLAANLHGAWVSFIKGQTVKFGTITWPKYTDTNRYTVVISNASAVVSDPIQSERQLWVNIGALPA